jgi:anti-sigma regulatory factor (Ser/Thr protein kinase)
MPERGKQKRLEPFHHIALMYAGRDEFVRETAAFLRAGLEAGEPAMVMVGQEKIDALRDALGGDAHAVRFVDMARAGRNPAWIIPAWREFADAHPGRRMRGIGEPIWAGRTPDELVECQRHESLLNHAFADAEGFKLLCPYDTAALDESVLDEARRSHPCIAHDGAERESDSYRGVDACAAPFEAPLPEPETVVRGLPFNADTLDAVRRSVRRHAEREGLGDRRRDDLVLAVDEIASNSVRHGGGYGRLRLWSEGGAVVCEVRDRGAIAEPLAGRERPDPGEVGRYGLWLAHQVCDLVQVRTLPSGGVVRLHMRRE